MYLKIVNGQPQEYDIHQLRVDNPNVSFPSSLSADVLADYGVYEYSYDPEPTYNSRFQSISAGAIYQKQGGTYGRAWVVTDFVPAEISKVQMKRATETIEHAPGVTLWAAIKSALAAADADTQEEWGLITSVPRSHPTVLALAAGLGKTEAEMDAVWVAGAQL